MAGTASFSARDTVGTTAQVFRADSVSGFEREAGPQPGNSWAWITNLLAGAGNLRETIEVISI
jgi:hypothetical protein